MLPGIIFPTRKGSILKNVMPSVHCSQHCILSKYPLLFSKKLGFSTPAGYHRTKFQWVFVCAVNPLAAGFTGIGHALGAALCSPAIPLPLLHKFNIYPPKILCSARNFTGFI
jgi:hypothetical protein